MIYWGKDNELISCKFCNHPRYKRHHGSNKQKTTVPHKKMYYFPLTPHLQRLYESKATANGMRWHKEHNTEEGAMQHCSDSQAWKHFDQIHPSFVDESLNARLGLCTYGLQSFGKTGQQYSLWPVIVIPYNFPPRMCKKYEYMLLSIIVHGLRNPKEKLDVFLQPLIAELKHFWEVSVQTYDVSSKQNFQMQAALMWTISDFPAYSMLSGWSIAGKLACPYCMENSNAFSLSKGGKTSWFDNHRKFLLTEHPFRRNKKAFRKGQIVLKCAPPIRSGVEILELIEHYGFKKVTEIDADGKNARISKNYHFGWKKRSIFWDLPYWKTNLIRHNLDVMHVEKKFFDNIFSTIMNVEGKTKDNAKLREDIKEFCSRPELHRDETTNKFPKACYRLEKDANEALYKWLKVLRFPDGYASNMGRCVDMKKHKLFGMKSHDCHVFMQRLIPIAFHELLIGNVWQALTEISIFF